MMNNIKLGVEVISAHDLMPKDDQGASNAFVELEFDHQKFRTTIKDRDLNPFWNERFYFNVSDPMTLADTELEATVYHFQRPNNSKSFLGKVKIAGTSFANSSDATVLHYPLEKRGIFSRVRGELGLKVFLTDDPSVRVSDPVAEFEAMLSTPSEASNHRRENQYNTANIPSRTFQHLPRDEQRQFPQQGQQNMQKQQFSSSMPPPSLDIPGGSQYMTTGQMRPEPPRPQMLRMFSSSGQQPVDYQLKETSPSLGGGRIVRGRVISRNKPGTYDLVEQMQYLFIRIVKARHLPHMDLMGSLDPYVEARLGNHRLKTKTFAKNRQPEWDEVFAFPAETIQASELVVVVKDQDLVRDDFVGRVRFDLNELPTRVPPDSPLAPEWYRLEGKDGDKSKAGEIMLAVWIGTQADESFPYAYHADSEATDQSIDSTHTRGKVYPAPRLWYVRVKVLEAQDLVMREKNKIPDVFVKMRIGNCMMRTKSAQSRNMNFQWNEDHMMIAAEPFDDFLIITVVDQVGVNKDEHLGEVEIPLSQVDKRSDHKSYPPIWVNLKSSSLFDLEQLKDHKFSSKIRLQVWLEGGYHVLDESTQYSSDLRPTMKQLWKPPIGILELGILSIDGLPSTKTRDSRASCDAYCVAKYGQKWVRTRTIVGNLSPRFNEQYTWDVYDHATVLTVGVFDNFQLEDKSITSSESHRSDKDHVIGKVRVRLSTLETRRVYTHTYPLLVLRGSGVKKMGDLHLAIRFTTTSLINSLYVYTRPLLPKMHYTEPLNILQQEVLRQHAVQIVAERLGRAEPPLRREIVEYMSDARAHLFSMRRSKANFFRLMSVVAAPLAIGRWLTEVCAWKNPVTTVLVHVLHVMLVMFPELILPTIFLYMFLIGLWNYRYRPQYPPHMNTRLSHADGANPDELDEEFDTFPTSRPPELVKYRYDRLRSVAGRVQTVVGDVATQGERIQSLLSWRDPRATAVFLLFCIIAAVTLYVTPIQVLLIISGFYVMRHPRFRKKLPSPPMNFFRRLPARTDSLL